MVQVQVLRNSAGQICRTFQGYLPCGVVSLAAVLKAQHSVQGSLYQASLHCLQVACGVSESHQMAFVLHPSGLQGLGVPLPAVAQEYVDHGGLVWKVYVAGDKVRGR